MRVITENNDVIVFEEGSYDKHSGLVNYKTTEYPEIICKLNSLHASSTDSPKHWLNISYGVLLGFLALSSLWMYKPSTRMFRRGIVLSVAGLVLTAIIVVL